MTGQVPPEVVDHVLRQCLGVAAGEVVHLLVDSGTDPDVVTALTEGLHRHGARPGTLPLPRYDLPGAEPGPQVAAQLLDCAAAIELTSTFIGSSRARREATAAGVRYLCMPAVTADTFRVGGPLDVDFDALVATTTAVAAAWAGADTFRLTAPGGTDLSGSVRGRGGRALTGIAREPGSYMCPPDVEAGTAPVEGSASGTVVVDGDLLFLGTGPVREPVGLTFRDGALVGVEGGADADRLRHALQRLDDHRMANLAEVSLGLNPHGSICAVPMETEATLGSAHIALGNSIAYGGTVAAPAHLDCVLREATLALDGVPVMAAGRWLGPAHPPAVR